MFGEAGALGGLSPACPLCDRGVSGVAPPPLHTVRFSPPMCDKESLWKPHWMVSGGIWELLASPAETECPSPGRGAKGGTKGSHFTQEETDPADNWKIKVLRTI